MLNHGYSTDLDNLLVDGGEAQGFPQNRPGCLAATGLKNAARGG
jgi:hypothetical protein